MESKLKNIHLHPFLFCIYPIIYLYSVSIGEVRITDTLLPLGINLIIMTIPIIIFLILTKNSAQAFVQSTLLLVLYSNLGQTIFLLLEKGYFQHDQRPVVIIFLTMYIVLSWVNLRFIKNYKKLTEFLNVVSIALLIFPLFTIIKNHIQAEDFSPPPVEIIEAPQEFPDIYYIVLDTYAGNDLLSSVYNFDNFSFLNSLEEKGFYVADDSYSNYMVTQQSLGSSLNLNYLSDERIMKSFYDNQAVSNNPYGLISNNFVKNQLEAIGYQTYVIPNFSPTTSWEGGHIIGNIPLSTPFFFEYMKATALILFSDTLPYQIYREQILNGFKLMEHSLEIEGPKFVFFHVIIPHQPFVFDKDGNSINPNGPFVFSIGLNGTLTLESHHEKYIEQLQFTNLKIDELLTNMLAQIDRQSIIIVQGDHGPAAYTNFYSVDENRCMYERFSILNAYYLPGFDYEELYPGISPVNTFRLIFNHYFDLPYELLEDRHYFPDSTAGEVNFIDVTDNVRSQDCVP